MPLIVLQRSLALILVVAGLSLSTVALATSVAATPGNEDNITFCHATSSATNPFVLVTTDPASIIRAGHGEHSDDIIPAFDYPAFGNTEAGSFPGLNLEGGGEILAAGCIVEPDPVVTPEPTDEPEPTPTPEPTVTPTDEPDPTPTVTPTEPTPTPTAEPTPSAEPTPTIPELPTPTLEPTPGTEPTVTPTTPAPSPVVPSVTPSVTVSPEVVVIVKPSTSPAPFLGPVVPQAARQVQVAALPVTGTPAGQLIAAGLGLILIGGVVFRVAR